MNKGDIENMYPYDFNNNSHSSDKYRRNPARGRHCQQRRGSR